MNSENDFQSGTRTPPASPDIRDVGIRADQNQTPAGGAGFINQKQLLARLPISRRASHPVSLAERRGRAAASPKSAGMIIPLIDTLPE